MTTDRRLSICSRNVLVSIFTLGLSSRLSETTLISRSSCLLLLLMAISAFLGSGSASSSTSPPGSFFACFSAWVSKPSMSSNRSPSIVPTKRPLRNFTHWSAFCPGFIDPMYMLLPSYTLSAQAFISITRLTNSTELTATAWKSAAGAYFSPTGGPSSSGEFNQRSTSLHASMAERTFSKSNFLVKSTCFNGFGWYPLSGAAAEAALSTAAFSEAALRSPPPPVCEHLPSHELRLWGVTGLSSKFTLEGRRRNFSAKVPSFNGLPCKLERDEGCVPVLSVRLDLNSVDSEQLCTVLFASLSWSNASSRIWMRFPWSTVGASSSVFTWPQSIFCSANL
mmetsp:Transcript_17484/g.47865  ORF Transcript_17484/g.47865 Transcript_17484/m.47865 type:complete len:337 (-) Transcript_17484:841-1851(-)